MRRSGLYLGRSEGAASLAIDLQLKKNLSDVVHDILAYLAEQMIEMNKAKNEEVKGFLKWLERGIGCSLVEIEIVEGRRCN